MNESSLLPHVIFNERSEHHCQLQLQVPLDCIWFDGHFDNAPILSGVAQIGWVMALAKRFLNIEQPFCGIDVLKFQRVIVPGDTLTMKLQHIAEKQQLNFSLSADTPISSGRIILGERKLS